MKKLLGVLMFVVLVFALAGCQPDDEENDPADRKTAIPTNQLVEEISVQIKSVFSE